MKRVMPILLIIIFLTGLFTIPPVLTGMNNQSAPIDIAIPSQNTDLTVRVAIYDEDNFTVPLGANPTLSGFTNHLSEVETLLEGAGHEVTLLTTEDIENHELILANYDVFILLNNLPKNSVSNLVKEFWLGGGGLLTFNKAFSYLSYKSIVWPGLGIDGYGILWGNLTCDVMNVTARHPTMKEHHINDTISERVSDWAVIVQSVLDGSDVWYTITPLLTNKTNSDLMYGFAMDSKYEGGRLVHLPGDGSLIPTDFESIIVDSVEWLMPRPKGRIIFDYTHQPRIGIDSWDYELVTVYSPPYVFEQFRNLAVNHSYTFDKLYPSSAGNITAARLAPYDVLIMAWPDLNYTAAEGAVIDEWVNGGGSLLVLGDRTELGFPNDYGDETLNMVLQNFEMSLGTTNEMITGTMTPGTHVTLEGCTGLTMGPRNYLSVLGSATTIWFDGTHPVVAGQEYGAGRAIVSADMNVFDNGQLSQTSNSYFALNVLNWLTAADAEILVHSDYLGWNDAVCKALRDLGLSYQFFNTRQYLDDFLDSKSWDLLIYNNVNYWPESIIYDELYAFVNTGGTLMLTTFTVDNHPTHPLWSKMGVEWEASLSGTPSMYFWDASHPIFTEPNNHMMNNYTSIVLFGDDGDTVVYFEGHTALAGTTTTPQNGTATIVVSDDRKTLFNTLIIDNFATDEDDSTYEDRIELWQNEIVFMMTEPTTTGGGFPLDTTTLLIIGGGAVGLIVILALLMRRRGGSKPTPKTRKKK